MKFSDHKFCKSGDIIILICHMTNVTSYVFKAGLEPLMTITILPCLVAIGLLQMEL